MNGKPQRREAKGFDPPPWERDAFEELSRKKAADRAEADLDAALAGLASPEPEPGEPAEGVHDEAGLPTPAEATPAQPGGADGGGSAVDEARTAAMLSRLAEEEPDARAHGAIGLVVAGFLAVLGLMMLGWGIIGAVRTAGVSEAGPVGLIGGVILGGFGIGLVAAAAWLAAKALKQRGEH